jgi:hypothetical protein
VPFFVGGLLAGRCPVFTPESGSYHRVAPKTPNTTGEKLGTTSDMTTFHAFVAIMECLWYFHIGYGKLPIYTCFKCSITSWWF